MKDGHLYQRGAWGDQSHRRCQGLDVLDSEIKRRDAEEHEDAMKKAAKKRG